MLREGKVELAYQIASDLNESGSLYYCNQVLQTVQARLGEGAKQLVSILNGELKRKALHLFLTQNSNVDAPFLKSLLAGWRPKESYINSAVGASIGTLLAFTQSSVHLKDYIKNFALVKNWSLFTIAASFGLINQDRDGFVQEAKELTLNEKSPYCTGGLLYATGLSNFGNTHKEDLRAANLKNIKAKEEPIQHGAILALGLQNALSNDEGLIDHVKTILYSEKALPGEAAGFAINLIKATHYSSDHVEEMVNLCQNNPHDKIARAAIGSIGLTAINSNADIAADYAKMIGNKDPHIRLGAVGLLSLRYFGSAHTETVNELLRIIATDLSNDVRRLAVIGLGFVLTKKRSKAFLLLKMLSSSYNPYIRHAVALTLGILYVHSFDKKVTKLLQRLLDDKVDYVRQAASIGLGLVFQLGSENLDQNFETVKTQLTERLNKKVETSLAKFGHMLGLAMMQPGGENCIVNLNRLEAWSSSYVRPQSIIGIFLFTFYWYWYPMTLTLGLAFEPTCLIGVTGDLRIPKGFQFVSKASKKTFDYYKTPENVEEKKNEIAPTILSTTKRVLARQGKVVAKQETDSPDKAMQIEENKPEGEAPKAEEKRVILNNPHRILKKQINLVDFNVDNRRYQPVVENRRVGILFLKDQRAGEREDYADEQPKEAWLVPPPEFKFEAPK
jgi:26S proteasome regulatory subunit N2